MLLIAVSNIVFSQAFPVEQDKFIKAFGQELNYTGEIRPDAKSIDKEFTKFWESDSLTFLQKSDFINTVNLMASKGCKGYPDFVCFADNMLLFTRKNTEKDQYEIYEKALIDLLNDGKRPKLNNISDYLINMNALLSKNIVSKGARTYWKAENNNFYFKYDNGIKIVFTGINLIGYQGVDSLKIYKTNGEYLPVRNSWIGKDGTVGWERVRYSMDSIQAKLSNYSIDMRNITYSADSVMFMNSMFFKQPMMGKLIDKAGNLDNPKKSEYPTFVSYNQHFELKNIVKGIDYEGGFSIKGSSFIGSGTKEELAMLKIVKADTLSFTAYSREFLIDNEMIVTNNCAIILKMNEDSIYHPHLTLRFHNKMGLLELIRTKEDMSKVHFTNSYHAITMDFTWFKWFIDKYKIEFSMIKTAGVPNEAMFESADYYRLDRYREIQKRDPQHPLAVLTGFVNSWAGYPEFYLGELASYMGYSPAQVVQMVLDLAYRGYLSYDTETQLIRLYPEAWRFMEAHRKTKDSDVIQFYSKTEADIPNAELSLINFDLKMNGISYIHCLIHRMLKLILLIKKL